MQPTARLRRTAPALHAATQAGEAEPAGAIDAQDHEEFERHEDQILISQVPPDLDEAGLQRSPAASKQHA